MITLFAHAGHTHTESMVSTTTWTDSMPIIVGAGIMITILLATIIYMLVMWQPKSFADTKKPAATAKKKTTKK